MARIRYSYKYNKYSWKNPPRISTQEYSLYKTLTDREVRHRFALKNSFLKDSIPQLIGIAVGILSFFYIYNSKEIGDLLGILLIIVIITGALSLLSFGSSLLSFLDITFENDSYIDHLIQSMKTSSDYPEFCRLMAVKFSEYKIEIRS